MLAPVTHILPLTTICRPRILPAPGRIVVRKGQKVSPNDTIAEASLHPEHILLDVARGLGLLADQADRHMQRSAGEEVDGGDVLAGPVGLARRVVRAPKAGRVVLAGGGQVLLEVASDPFLLKAGIQGVITQLISDRGAEIEITGALIQGSWGNGLIESGLILVVTKSPEDQLTREQLNVSQRGSILLGGYCSEAAVLEAAAELPLRGLILSSMDSSLVLLAQKMAFPILVLEGFGRLPMNHLAHRLLSSSERREATLFAQTWDRLAGSRPEIIIPLPATGQPPVPNEAVSFTPGQQVRVLRAPRHGATGKLVKLHQGLVTLPNGVKTLAADVRLEGGEVLVMPLANLEVII